MSPALCQDILHMVLQTKVFQRVAFRRLAARSPQVLVKCAKSQVAPTSQDSEVLGWAQDCAFSISFLMLCALHFEKHWSNL